MLRALNTPPTLTSKFTGIREVFCSLFYFFLYIECIHRWKNTVKYFGCIWDLSLSKVSLLWYPNYLGLGSSGVWPLFVSPSYFLSEMFGCRLCLWMHGICWTTLNSCVFFLHFCIFILCYFVCAFWAHHHILQQTSIKALIEFWANLFKDVIHEIWHSIVRWSHQLWDVEGSYLAILT